MLLAGDKQISMDSVLVLDIGMSSLEDMCSTCHGHMIPALTRVLSHGHVSCTRDGVTSVPSVITSYFHSWYKTLWLKQKKNDFIFRLEFMGVSLVITAVATILM